MLLTTEEFSIFSFIKNLPSLSPLPHLSEVGQGEENVHGDSLLPQESPPSHAGSDIWKNPGSCEGAVLGFLKMPLFLIALSWALKHGAVSGQLWLCPSFLPSFSSCNTANTSFQRFIGHPLLFCSPSPHPLTCPISSHPKTPFSLLQELLKSSTVR